MQATEKDFKKVISEVPGLVSWGLSVKRRNEKYYRGRFLLKSYVPEFQLCCDWLSLCKKRKTVNRRIGSCDTLRRTVESWAGCYISTGALIAAVFHMGITYEEFTDFPNVYIALSSRCPFLKRSLEKRRV